MAKLYAKKVKSGKMALSKVPEIWQAEVRRILGL